MVARRGGCLLALKLTVCFSDTVALDALFIFGQAHYYDDCLFQLLLALDALRSALVHRRSICLQKQRYFFCWSQLAHSRDVHN